MCITGTLSYTLHALCRVSSAECPECHESRVTRALKADRGGRCRCRHVLPVRLAPLLRRTLRALVATVNEAALAAAVRDTPLARAARRARAALGQAALATAVCFAFAGGALRALCATFVLASLVKGGMKWRA